MNYTDRIKQLIESVVKANDNQEITGQRLQDVLIAMLDATEETYKLVDSLEVGGVALLQTLGNSETMGISQKVLTEYITNIQEQISQEISNREQSETALETELKEYTDVEQTRAEAAEQNLQDQIYDIIGGQTTVSLSVNPTAVFADGENKSVTFVATSSPNRATIIFDGREPVEGTRAEFVVVVNSSTPTAITKSATFTVAGVNKGTKSATVRLVYPIFYGAGIELNEVFFIQYQVATATPARTYDITIPEGGGYIYFKIPKEQVSQISKVVLDEENPSPIDGAIISSDSNYNVWRSNSQYDSGTYRIKVTA